MRRRSSPYSQIEEVRRSRGEVWALISVTVVLGLLLGLFTDGVSGWLQTTLPAPAWSGILIFCGLMTLALTLTVAWLFYGHAESSRARRPPPDPANALLSLGYSLLTQNMMTAAEVVALDPYDGFFHADKHGRPALALDLEEEFRSIIVDSVVLTVINKKILAPGDFRPGPKGGVRLKPDALKTFFRQYGRRIHTRIKHPRLGRRLTYLQCFEVQARTLARVIEGQTDIYTPFLTR